MINNLSAALKLKTGVMLFLIITIFIILSGCTRQRRSERYLDAYKKYEDAICPVPDDGIRNYVYFARDREAIHDHPFLNCPRFEGAQIMYAWRQLEPEKDRYDFSVIDEDFTYLKSYGKKLFIQLQDATFSPQYRAVPDYLMTAEYDSGAVVQRNDNGRPEGWVAKRWNRKVQERFALLLSALGKAFDGKIEGINLQESSIGVSVRDDSSFTPAVYAAALKTNMLALKKAFPNSTTMQYANFMPGEWLPSSDKGYLRSLYEYGERIGVGLGAPDLMVRRKGQLNHAYAMMHEQDYTVPLGIAVQDGNYIGQTGSMEVNNDHQNLVPMLHAFARDFLRVGYMFWVNQEPYFEQDVLPCFNCEKEPDNSGIK
jgi:hypothetical protein